MSTQVTIRLPDALIAQAQGQAEETRSEVLRRWVEQGSKAEEAVRDLRDQVDGLRQVVEAQQALIEQQAEEARKREEALAGRVEELLRGVKAQDQHAQVLRREVAGLYRAVGAQRLSRRKRTAEAVQAEAQELRRLAGLD